MQILRCQDKLFLLRTSVAVAKITDRFGQGEIEVVKMKENVRKTSLVKYAKFSRGRSKADVYKGFGTVHRYLVSQWRLFSCCKLPITQSTLES